MRIKLNESSARASVWQLVNTMRTLRSEIKMEQCELSAFLPRAEKIFLALGLLCKVTLVCLTPSHRTCYLCHRSIAQLFMIYVVNCVFII